MAPLAVRLACLLTVTILATSAPAQALPECWAACVYISDPQFLAGVSATAQGLPFGALGLLTVTESGITASAPAVEPRNRNLCDELPVDECRFQPLLDLYTSYSPDFELVTAKLNVEATEDDDPEYTFPIVTCGGPGVCGFELS